MHHECSHGKYPLYEYLCQVFLDEEIYATKTLLVIS